MSKEKDCMDQYAEEMSKHGKSKDGCRVCGGTGYDYSIATFKNGVWDRLKNCPTCSGTGEVEKQDKTMKEIEKIFKDNIDVPNIFSFDGEDWMYYGDDPEIERQLESVRDMWYGFKRAFKASEDALRKAYETIVNNNFTVNAGMREIAQKWLKEHPDPDKEIITIPSVNNLTGQRGWIREVEVDIRKRVESNKE